MIVVLDASIVVDLITDGSHAAELKRIMSEGNATFAAPHLLDVEVTSALRSLVVGQRIGRGQATEYLLRLSELPVERCAHTDLLPRIWELRHNFTPYVAAYIALAEQLEATLYTADRKLLKGHKARVVLFNR